MDHFEEDVRRQLSAFAIQESGLEEGTHQKVLEDWYPKIRERRAKNVRGSCFGESRTRRDDRERRNSKPSCWSVKSSREGRAISERKRCVARVRGEIDGKGGKLKEVEQLISIDGDKGYLPFDEVNDIPTNDIVSSDQIDDVLMMFDEMDIDEVEDGKG